MEKKQFAYLLGVMLAMLITSSVNAQCNGVPIGNQGYPTYYPPTTYYQQPVQQVPVQTYTPTIIHHYPQQSCCQPGVTFAPIEFPSSTVTSIPVDSQPVVSDSNLMVGTIEPVDSVTKDKVETPVDQPWNQWAGMPPLRGDFQAMIQQVTGDIDWMLTAQGEKFSPDLKAILVEAKTNLETSCRVCDEDPDLFAGVQPGGESVRDVTEQLESFRELIAKSLQQPSMQSLAATIAPARKDKSRVKGVMGGVDAATKQRLLGMFALETIGKRGDELLAHAKSVENGTFRPVGVDSLQQDLKPGDVAPNFSIQTVTGEMVSLADYQGKKVVLVFNRGHFCPYCMNQVGQLANSAADIDAEVLAIFRETPPGKDAQAGIEGLQAYQAKSNPPFKLGVDFGSQATSAYSRSGHFSTYVIDSNGKIASELRGVKYIRPSAAAIAKAVDKAL